MLCDSLTMSITSSLFPSELHFTAISTKNKNYNHSGNRTAMAATVLCCSNSTASTPPISKNVPPLVMKQKKRYRKLYPGEAEGITEEMRFVAMRLRNVKGKYVHKSGNSSDEDEEGSMNEQNPSNKQEVMEEEEGNEAETWFPTIEGFIKYLVDSKLVFDTIERVIDESSDVAYSYFRKTGLERSECLSKDLDWFSLQNFVIPEPSTAGVSYVKYLDELAEKSAPLFLCHFYNIYFSHIAGGQVITRQVSEKIIEGRELEFCKWEGDVEESLKGVREKLNMLGEHWTRDEKNKCLKETTKSFRFMGQIVRLIIL